MVYIYQNQANNILTRFFDRRTSTSSYFLWKIVNEFSGDSFYYITEDISDNTCAYNVFPLVHSDTGSKVGGINIPIYIPAGHNTYTVYETSEYSLDPQYIIKEIETDIMFVEIVRDVNSPDSQINDVYY